MFVKLLKDWKGKPAGEQIDVPEEFAPFLVDSKTAEPVANDPIGSLITKSLETATGKWAQSMDQVIALTLKKFQEAQSQAKRHAVPAIFGEDGDGDPKKNFGDFALAVARQDTPYLEKHYGSTRIDYTAKAALAEASEPTPRHGRGSCAKPKQRLPLTTIMSCRYTPWRTRPTARRTWLCSMWRGRRCANEFARKGGSKRVRRRGSASKSPWGWPRPTKPD
jgi:hypothetical protein